HRARRPHHRVPARSARLRAGGRRARRGDRGARRRREGPVGRRRDRAARPAPGRPPGRQAEGASTMRRILDAFAMALASLGEHKLRTALTMLGMMFGVGAVIAMMAIGAGAEGRALALIERLGTRNIVIHGKTYKPAELQELRKK